MKTSKKSSYPFFLIVILCGLVVSACSTNREKRSEEKNRLVLNFEFDESGNISDESIKKQLAEIANKVSANADRVMLYSYTEALSSDSACIALATKQAYAAKTYMYNVSPARVYYNVGLAIEGCKNPLDATDPQNRMNRRIEIEFM